MTGLDALGIKGIGSEGVIGITIFLLIKFLIIPWFRKVKYGKPEYNRRNSDKKNPNSKPGNAQVCKDHMKKLAEIETTIKMSQKENEKEHKQMDGRLTKLFDLWDNLKFKRT